MGTSHGAKIGAAFTRGRRDVIGAWLVCVAVAAACFG
jgi:hypothetical protein